MSSLNLVAIISISVISIIIGLFLFLNPGLAIELQRRFYEKINWRIEPISMSREIRNTKLMGLFLIITALATAIYMLLKNPLFYLPYRLR